MLQKTSHVDIENLLCEILWAGRKYNNLQGGKIMKIKNVLVLAGLMTLSTLPAQAQRGAPQEPQDTSMSFFITSVNPGNGGNLGGLAGADAYCATLAAAAGSTGKTWRAYLSTTGPNGVDARDRIGEGPWFNANGQMIASNVNELHYSNVNLTAETNINENGGSPMRHDIITGSNPDGTAAEQNCNNWTAGNDDYTTPVGHHNRGGGGAIPSSWNAAHQSRGCSMEAFNGTGGDGLYYCFAL